ncbi:MAG TPA: SDR family NAD(P)-dependent oxidoreductase [Mycobacteriales bacterium]|nr:SDR family NAD(P)-dependent oxidoreductase [Mycobacteriales bacterium]
MDWSGSVVVVTGASRGIGAAIARQAAARGARLGLLARNEAELKALAAELPTESLAVPVDVTVTADLVAALRRVRDELGPIDVLVNNAGIGAYGPFTAGGADQLDQLWPINVAAVAHGMAEVLPDMQRRGSGVIVNMTSIAGRIGAPGEAAYCASKFAVVGLSETVRAEVRDSGVKICLINPGPVATAFGETRGHPYDRDFPKPVSPEHVAKLTIRAIERGTPEIFIPRWLRPSLVFKNLCPPLFDAGVRPEARRMTKKWNATHQR